MSGWYTRVVTKATPQVRWLTVDNFWVSIYGNKKDLIPLILFHTSNLTIEDNPEGCNFAYAFRVNIGHTCALKKIIISTPNQFDIVEIKEKILQQQKEWNSCVETTQPQLPKSFSTDVTGKFVYKKTDRVFITVTEKGIEIKQEGKDDKEILFNDTFDTYTTMETESDSKWASISSNFGSYHLHFADIGELKSFVSECLHASSISKRDIHSTDN